MRPIKSARIKFEQKCQSFCNHQREQTKFAFTIQSSEVVKVRFSIDKKLHLQLRCIIYKVQECNAKLHPCKHHESEAHDYDLIQQEPLVLLRLMSRGIFYLVSNRSQHQRDEKKFTVSSNKTRWDFVFVVLLSVAFFICIVLGRKTQDTLSIRIHIVSNFIRLCGSLGMDTQTE